MSNQRGGQCSVAIRDNENVGINPLEIKISGWFQMPQNYFQRERESLESTRQLNSEVFGYRRTEGILRYIRCPYNSRNFASFLQSQRISQRDKILPSSLGLFILEVDQSFDLSLTKSFSVNSVVFQVFLWFQMIWSGLLACQILQASFVQTKQNFDFLPIRFTFRTHLLHQYYVFKQVNQFQVRKGGQLIFQVVKSSKNMKRLISQRSEIFER